MSDKLIRELLINVKQKGAASTAKSIQKVADGLVDAGAASELTNEQLAKMPKTLYSIERAAERATKSLARMQAFNPKGATSGMRDMSVQLEKLSAGIFELTAATRSGFDDMIKASNHMASTMGKQLETVNDRLYDTSRAVRRAGGEFTQIGGSAAGAARAIGNTSGAARGATRDFAAMAGAGGKLPIMYAMIASNVFVLQSAFEQLKMGDQLNRLEQFGKIVGSTTGTPVQTLAASLQEAAGYAISFEEAMKQASMASAYGFDAEQLKQFGLVARRAAATLGIDMVDALNRVIKGVSKQEIELLDELGVTIRLNDAYANYVKQLNAANTGITYTINNLSSFQKQQAYANAVVEESTRRFSHLDEVLRATPWEMFAANADSALRKVQQAAAKYLGPVIQSINTMFYTSQAYQSGVQADAQRETNQMIDPKNTGAVALGLASTKEGYDDALKLYTEAQQKKAKLRKQYDEEYAKASYLGQVAIDQTFQGLPFTTATGTSDANKANIERIANMRHEMERLDKEIADSTEMLNKWKAADDEMGKTASKANKGFQDRIKLQKDANDPGAVYDYNSAVLKGLVEEQKAYEQTRKTAQDLSNDIMNIAQNTDMASKTGATLESTFKTIQNLSGDDTAVGDELVKNLNLGYTSMKEMGDATQAVNGYIKAVGTTQEKQLAVAQEIDRVYKSTGDKKKAEAAGNALEIQQLNQQETALKRLLATNKGNKGIEKEIQAIQLDKLKITNGQMEATKEVKDRSYKVLGVEREIALLEDRSMDNRTFQIRQLEMELSLEEEKYEWFKKQGDKQVEMNQSLRAQAQIRRQQWEAEKQFQSERAADQEAELQRNQTSRNSQGQLQNLQEQSDLYKQILRDTEGNSAAQEAYTRKLLETEAAMKQIRAQRQLDMMSSVTSSVGGDYASTQGLMGEDKQFADMNNKMASYDTAISKLGALNSQAMEVAQSMGNLTNAMIQFSQGSLDTTSTIAAGMQMVSSMISMGANQQITALDAAIQAEQKRDGKSEQSKNKIKKMEAEKIKIQQDSAKKQIIIQTAVAVMQAATSVPFPWSIPLMVMAGAAGAMALAQASSASGMSSIADSGGETASYLTLGERQKNVDVSMQASAGESAYMRGDQGIGNANSFVPRAEGGTMYPGVAYKMGEHGTEIATPMVPMKATSADEVAAGNSGGSKPNIQLTVQAMDSQSFMDFAMSNPAAFRRAVELALNEEGQSLNSLGS